ncbi:hypothetical protein P5673_028097 [Acropora cervicornis]|uniref:Uncharacterized protein n=1 Tax=Acropora cervicornis TaxID=6130 RepID=A0AAD9PXW2_ACRCE|nr:hypothetical protein P5673_028097 [Acropora cervicornis]
MAKVMRAKPRYKKQQLEKVEECGELESITVMYDGKKHAVEFPKSADAKVIRQNIKSATGIKGSFYVHFGDSSNNNYLHCSSVTSSNLAKLAGNVVEVRGGNDFNKGGDATWYSNSQQLKPEVQLKFREMEIIPFDNPP